MSTKRKGLLEIEAAADSKASAQSSGEAGSLKRFKLDAVPDGDNKIDSKASTTSATSATMYDGKGSTMSQTASADGQGDAKGSQVTGGDDNKDGEMGGDERFRLVVRTAQFESYLDRGMMTAAFDFGSEHALDMAHCAATGALANPMVTWAVFYSTNAELFPVLLGLFKILLRSGGQKWITPRLFKESADAQFEILMQWALSRPDYSSFMSNDEHHQAFSRAVVLYARNASTTISLSSIATMWSLLSERIQVNVTQLDGQLLSALCDSRKIDQFGNILRSTYFQWCLWKRLSKELRECLKNTSSDVKRDNSRLYLTLPDREAKHWNPIAQWARLDPPDEIVFHELIRTGATAYCFKLTPSSPVQDESRDSKSSDATLASVDMCLPIHLTSNAGLCVMVRWLMSFDSDDRLDEMLLPLRKHSLLHRMVGMLTYSTINQMREWSRWLKEIIVRAPPAVLNWVDPITLKTSFDLLASISTECPSALWTSRLSLLSEFVKRVPHFDPRLSTAKNSAMRRAALELRERSFHRFSRAADVEHMRIPPDFQNQIQKVLDSTLFQIYLKHELVREASDLADSAEISTATQRLNSDSPMDLWWGISRSAAGVYLSQRLFDTLKKTGTHIAFPKKIRMRSYAVQFDVFFKYLSDVDTDERSSILERATTLTGLLERLCGDDSQFARLLDMIDDCALKRSPKILEYVLSNGTPKNVAALLERMPAVNPFDVLDVLRGVYPLIKQSLLFAARTFYLTAHVPQHKNTLPKRLRGALLQSQLALGRIDESEFSTNANTNGNDMDNSSVWIDSTETNVWKFWLVSSHLQCRPIFERLRDSGAPLTKLTEPDEKKCTILDLAGAYHMQALAGCLPKAGSLLEILPTPHPRSFDFSASIEQPTPHPRSFDFSASIEQSPLYSIARNRHSATDWIQAAIDCTPTCDLDWVHPQDQQTALQIMWTQHLDEPSTIHLLTTGYVDPAPLALLNTPPTLARVIELAKQNHRRRKETTQTILSNSFHIIKPLALIVTSYLFR